MSSSHIETILQSAFCESLSSWEQIGEAHVMGISGACITLLSCVLENKDEADNLKCTDMQCVLKQTSKQLPSLPPDADESKRMRAHRTDFSYGSECVFLRDRAHVLNSRGCRVPRPFFAGDNGISFDMLMEAFAQGDGWQQMLTIPRGAHTRAVLRWLARFHATFLPTRLGGGGVPVAIEGGWDYGTHMALEKRPESELENLAGTLDKFLEQFADAHPYFQTAGARSIGPRLQAVAKSVAWHLRPSIGGVEGGAEVFTVTHGDFKQANMFFRGEATEEAIPEVAVIDWQWTGAGVAATDVFFVCVMALSDESVENYCAEVSKVYHEELITALGGQEAAYPYEQLEREFKIAGLDLMRWITGARFVGFTPDKMKAANETVDINRGMWIRSMSRMVWLWQRAEEFLSGVDALLPNTQSAQS